jgi:hypothetical protein
MPVEKKAGCTVITGNAIRIYQLNVAIQAIRLEARGLRFKGGSVKAAWARKFDLSSRTPAADVVAKIYAEINRIREEGV